MRKTRKKKRLCGSKEENNNWKTNLSMEIETTIPYGRLSLKNQKEVDSYGTEGESRNFLNEWPIS